MTPDERVIRLSIGEWNVVLSALGLASSIAGKIAGQAAQQDVPVAAEPARPNGDLAVVRRQVADDP